MMLEVDREICKNHLAEGSLIVTFTKADGEERVMRCTTAMEFIPDVDHPKGLREGGSPDVQKVYDLDKEAWRSFRWDSVTDVVIDEEYN